eukprot:838804-Amphidinium_carterae.3
MALSTGFCLHVTTSANRNLSEVGRSHMLLAQGADIFFGIVIILHAVFLGIDIEASLRSSTGTPEGELAVVLLCIELVFTLIFTAELFARVRCSWHPCNNGSNAMS